MKAIAALFILTVLCHLNRAHCSHSFNSKVNSLAARSIGEKFKQALEDLKKALRTGNATAGIPVVDPFKLKHQDFNFKNKLTKLNGELNNFLLEGLSNYVVQNADFKFVGKKITIDLLWPVISGRTDYKVSNSTILGKFTIYGCGNVSIKAYGYHFATEANIKMDTKADRLSVLSFKNTAITLDKLKIHITGLYGDEELSELISVVVSENTPKILHDFQGDITALVNEKMFTLSNDYLKDKSLKELLQKLKK